MFSLELFQRTHALIAPRIVDTPLVHLTPDVVHVEDAKRGGVTIPVLDPRLTRDVWLKLECLQVTGSFKPRGALNRALSLPVEQAKRGIITASGGNHGLAVAFVGRSMDVATTIHLPKNASADKVSRIERWGAKVARSGDVWDDAHAAALEQATRDGLTYIHPFADPEIIAGQGTIALEVLRREPDTDLFIVAIGGGGLIAGLATAAKALAPHARIIGVEPVGAPTLFESLQAGRVVELPWVRTQAATLAPRKSDPFTFDLIQKAVEKVVLVTDAEMQDAAQFLLTTAGVGVELSGAAAMAAVLENKIDFKNAKKPCVLVCGAGTDAIPPPRR